MSWTERLARIAAQRAAGIYDQTRHVLDTFVQELRQNVNKASAAASGSGAMTNSPTVGGSNTPAPPDLRDIDPRLPDFAEETAKSLFWDPYALVDQVGYAERPSTITFATLQQMAWKVPVIHAIIHTRVNQVATFATPQKHRFDPGFRIRLRDEQAKATKADRKFSEELQRVVMQTGVVADPRGRDNFEAQLRKLTRDSLIYDQACLEIVPGRDGRPSEWYAVDAATIRRATSRNLFLPPGSGEVAYVQVYDNAVITEYTAEELAFMVRNPRTDIRAQGYGMSELEMLITTVTSILYAWNYNQNVFAQGSLQKGLLNITGAMTDTQLRAFRRQWYQQTAGVENAWRTPILNAEKVDWLNMQASNKDMEYSAWMDFLIKIACAMYSMDPIEVNFKYGSNSAKSVFDTGNRSKLVESKDRGLRPILRHVARLIDKHIIHPIDPNFTFEFVGLDSMSPKELADLHTQRVRTIYTLDEMRAENDMPPLPDGKGEIILDTNWIARAREIDAAKEQRRQAALQAAAAAAQASATPLNDQGVSAGPQAATPAGAQQAIPQAGGSAPGAIPGQGAQEGGGAAGANPEAPQSPDKDSIAELEGLLHPKHSSSITKSLAERIGEHILLELELDDEDLD